MRDRMQDAICPKCGAIFRTRAHAVDCIEGLHDQRFLDLALEVHRDHFAAQVKALNEEEE